MNFQAIRAIYIYEISRTRRTLLQSIVSPDPVDLTLFCRLRLGDRLAHLACRRGELWCLHRARADHAQPADAEHQQRLVRHLFSALCGNDLRDFVGADLGCRDRHRLCRRGGVEINRSRPADARHGGALHQHAYPASVLDAGVSGSDQRHLQPFRLRHRHLGGQFREAAIDSTSDRNAADLSRWQLLFDRYAAAVLAQRHA